MMQFFSSLPVWWTLKDFWNKNWAWASGGLFGVLYGIKTFPMNIPHLAVDWVLLLQLAKVSGLALLGGLGTNAGKWIIDAIRSKIEKKKKDTNP